MLEKKVKIDGIFVMNDKMLLETAQVYLENKTEFYNRNLDEEFIQSAGMILREVLGEEEPENRNLDATAQLILSNGIYKLRMIPLTAYKASPDYVKCMVNYDFLRWGCVDRNDMDALFKYSELIEVKPLYFSGIYGVAEEVMIL